MSGLRLLADDLTGALDAAAPFANDRGAITVTWLAEGEAGDAALPWPAPWPDDDAAISSTSRDLPCEAATHRVRWLSPGLADGAPAFKKIDSLLRGNTAAEIVAAHRAGGFAATLVCPAFPAQGRLVEGGRLFVRSASGAIEQGPDIRAMLLAAGGDEAIVVGDAASDAALAALAERHRGDRAVLWAGSSGLARTLAGPAVARPLPPAESVLIVTASRNEVTRAQLGRLRACRPEMVLRDDGVTDPVLLGSGVAARLAGGVPVALDVSPPAVTRTTAARMARCFAVLAGAARPDLLIVIGGDTLVRLLASLGCGRLAVRGEIRPGLPLGELVDGAWSGCALVSRSGAFDDGGTIAHAVSATAMGR